MAQHWFECDRDISPNTLATIMAAIEKDYDSVVSGTTFPRDIAKGTTCVRIDFSDRVTFADLVKAFHVDPSPKTIQALREHLLKNGERWHSSEARSLSHNGLDYIADAIYVSLLRVTPSKESS